MPKPARFVFTRWNYILILISVGLLVTGYVLMTGTGNTRSTSFNEDIYSFRRITLSPLIILCGYGVLIYAIMSLKGKSKGKNNSS